MKFNGVYTIIKVILAHFNLALMRLDKFTKSAVPFDLKLDLIFDVGANSGQYGTRLRRLGYTGTIVSFEPLSAAHNILIANSDNDEKWIVHSKIALGSKRGKSRIQVSSNSVSSSLLSMSQLHEDAEPDSLTESSEIVTIDTLDHVGPQYIKGHKCVGLKLDVQGFEMEVLRGASSIISKIGFIQLEMSLTELYQGQAMYYELDQHLRELGFELWGILPGFRDARNGRLLQFDGLYLRNRTIPTPK